MNVQEYLDKMKAIQAGLLTYLDCQENEEENYHQLIKLYDDHEIHHHPHKVKSVLHMLVHISNNHHRNEHFFSRIEKFIHKVRHGMKHYFSNYEIFNIFKSNKRVLLYLLKEGLVTIDKQIASVMKSDEFTKTKYPQYFFPEIKEFLSEAEIDQISKEIPDDFESKRKEGENHNPVCLFIRSDSLTEFVSYTSQQEMRLKSKVEPSMFETNAYLIKNQPTLIEYAAFFGSIQVLKYLISKNVDLSSSLWVYAIHGSNQELFHILKKKDVKPRFKFFEDCIKETVRCHNNEMLSYLHDNFMKKEKNQAIDVSSEGLRFYNFAFIQNDFNYASVFYDLCKYDYFTIVQDILKKKDVFNDKKKSRKRNIFVFLFF